MSKAEPRKQQAVPWSKKSSNPPADLDDENAADPDDEKPPKPPTDLDEKPFQGFFMMEDARRAGAVCLDGSPGVYYFREGYGTGSHKWFIYHKGGNLCHTLDDCLKQSKTPQGSSKTYKKILVRKFQTRARYFSTDPALNPMMYNWNMVQIMSCDGGLYAGANAFSTFHKGHILHWRGKYILLAAIADLIANRGLSTATDVILGGFSTGGLAVYLHCDDWSLRIRATGNVNARITCVPDSGYFVDHEGPEFYHSRMIWTWQQFNATSSVDADCLAKERPRHNCIFAQYAVKYITTPLFALQGNFDKWMMDHIMGFAFDEYDVINAWSKQYTQNIIDNLLNATPHHRQNGLVLFACSKHQSSWNLLTDGDVHAVAFKQWYEKGGGCRRTWIHNSTYPCPPCCKQHLIRPGQGCDNRLHSLDKKSHITATAQSGNVRGDHAVPIPVATSSLGFNIVMMVVLAWFVILFWYRRKLLSTIRWHGTNTKKTDEDKHARGNPKLRRQLVEALAQAKEFGNRDELLAEAQTLVQELEEENAKRTTQQEQIDQFMGT